MYGAVCRFVFWRPLAGAEGLRGRQVKKIVERGFVLGSCPPPKKKHAGRCRCRRDNDVRVGTGFEDRRGWLLRTCCLLLVGMRGNATGDHLFFIRILSNRTG
jgi:hypothetical protein